MEFFDIMYDYLSIREVYLICNIINLGVVIFFGYNGLLILSCIFYVFKIRNVLVNFNEVKYIVFIMYIICIIWLVFVLIYFGSNYKIIIMCFLVSFSVIVVLGCMFVLKVYIILVKLERNVRSVFITFIVVRMYVGDGKLFLVVSRFSSLVNLWKRRGFFGEILR